MRLAYVTIYDPTDVHSFGGRNHYMLNSLRRQFEAVDCLGPLSRRKLAPLLLAKKYLHQWSNNKVYVPERAQLLVKNYAHQISRKLTRSKPDIVFSPMSPASQPIAYLDCNQPIVFWTDATFAGAMNFYPGCSSDRLCQETIRDGLANEEAALNRCSLAIYWSEWAAQTALKNYQVNPAKVRVVPAGANIDCDRNLEDIKTMVEARTSNTCRLLFLGYAWERKGGEIAVQVAKTLNQMGLETELMVVGCNPRIDESCSRFVKVMGRVDKSTPEGKENFDRLLAESHFLILPTQAEAYGLVFCEASSFGVPSLATRIGGIPTAVRDGFNGKTFSKEAEIREYCEYIIDLFSHYNRYKDLALSSFNEYETRLNWSTAVSTVKKMIMELV